MMRIGKYLYEVFLHPMNPQTYNLFYPPTVIFGRYLSKK